MLSQSVLQVGDEGQGGNYDMRISKLEASVRGCVGPGDVDRLGTVIGWQLPRRGVDGVGR